MRKHIITARPKAKKTKENLQRISEQEYIIEKLRNELDVLRMNIRERDKIIVEQARKIKSLSN